MADAIWYEAVPVLPQSQESLADQLNKLVVAANRLGLFDAADWVEDRISSLRGLLEEQERHP